MEIFLPTRDFFFMACSLNHSRTVAAEFYFATATRPEPEIEVFLSGPLLLPEMLSQGRMAATEDGWRLAS
jgi:hypothetical protein